MSPPDPEELSKGDNACKEEKCYKKYTTNRRQRWDDFEKKIIQKVQRVLPQWLTEPDVIQRDITSNLVPISDVPGICTRLQRELEGNGIQHLFPGTDGARFM